MISVMDRVKVVYYKSQSATSINYKNVVKFFVFVVFLMKIN